MKFVARVNDDVGVASVRFTVNGTEVGLDPLAPYEATALVPANAPTGGVLAVVARATDTSGNAAESSLDIPVNEIRDTTPPTVTLTAPADAYPGQLIDVSATASDAGGIATVAFGVDGANLASLTTAPFATTYRVADTASPGTTLAVTARATDYAALTADTATSVRVISVPTLSRGVVTGEAFDDATGLPLGGALVTASGVDASGIPYAGQLTADARGRFTLRTAAGDLRLRISKPGYTTVNRVVTVAASTAVAMFDARLTPLRAAVPVAGSLGTGIGDDAARLVLAPGSTTMSQLAVTPVSQQGLAGRLPFGWSPVGAADVAPAGSPFAGAATLKVANAFAVAAGAPIVVAQWDPAMLAWRAVGEAVLDGSTNTLSGSLPSTGQFAFLVADVVPAPPPPAVLGEAIVGVATPVVPASVTTTIDPEPRILFYRPGALSTVRGRLDAAVALTSGLHIVGRVSESYRFFSGDEVHPEAFESDLTFYQVPGATTRSAADVVVTPSLSFEAAALERGVIGFELIVPGPRAARR